MIHHKISLASVVCAHLPAHNRARWTHLMWMLAWLTFQPLSHGQVALLKTRDEVVKELTSLRGAIPWDLEQSTAWMPRANFGFGSNHLGLLPAGTVIESFGPGSQPFTNWWFGPGSEPFTNWVWSSGGRLLTNWIQLSGTADEPFERVKFAGPGSEPFTNIPTRLRKPAYLIFLDDFQSALFAHPTRFVIIDAENSAPASKASIPAGRLPDFVSVYSQEWWPVITTPDGTTKEWFSLLDERASDQPPGPDNPQGYLGGPILRFADLKYPDEPESPIIVESAQARPHADPAAQPCALIIRGHSDSFFGNDVLRFERDLRDIYGVPSNRIHRANGGRPATCDQIEAAIKKLCESQPPCSKIHVRITTHGNKGKIQTADGFLSAVKLCQKLKTLAAKFVPICLQINACYSGSLLDSQDWNFPDGSVIITAADAEHPGWAGTGSDTTITNTTRTNVVGSLLPHALSNCLRDRRADVNRDGRVDDIEAYQWVLTNRPCYVWPRSTTFAGPVYPAGTTNRAGKVVQNPGPTIRVVGRSPNYINLNVCNATGRRQTNFHLYFAGDLRTNATTGAWESDAQDKLGKPWSTNGVSMTYDPTNNVTMVCFGDPQSPIGTRDYVHFGVCLSTGNLRPIRQHWGNPVTTGGRGTKAPTRQNTLRSEHSGNSHTLRSVALPDPETPGLGTIQSQVFVRASLRELTLEELSLSSKALQNETVPVPNGSFNTLLIPDQPVETQIPLSPTLSKATHLILVSTMQWEDNETVVTELAQFRVAVESTPEVPQIRFTLSPQRREIVLDWESSIYFLEITDRLGSPWRRVEVANKPFVVPTQRSGQFFRLQRAE